MGRTTSGILALAMLGSLAACSDGEERTTTQEPSAPSTSQMAVLAPGECTLEAEVTGDAEGELSSKGEYNGSINESQPSIYRFSPGAEEVVVYAAAGGIQDAVTFSLDDSTYSTTAGEFDIDPEGTGATFDATAQSTDGQTVQIVGAVVCQADGPDGAGAGKNKSSKKG